jgi:hypothetical protein
VRFKADDITNIVRHGECAAEKTDDRGTFSAECGGGDGRRSGGGNLGRRK